MGLAYLWDTNTVIYYLQQLFPPKGEAWMDKVISSNKPVLSIITEIELLGWKSAHPEDLRILKGFVENSSVIGLEPNIKDKTIEIRRLHSIKLPDAVIAATALTLDLELITRNVSDFAAIAGIQLSDPFSRL